MGARGRGRGRKGNAVRANEALGSFCVGAWGQGWGTVR